MWILQCDDPTFEPKQVWLAPGSEHVLGRKRSKPRAIREERIIGINSKSVSRKHAILTVGAARRGSSSDLLQKHDLTIADVSRHGTSIDGIQVPNKPPTLLHADRQLIQLGSCEFQIWIAWRPVCLALTHISRSKKSYEVEVAALRTTLEPAGIKLSTDLVPERTTHLVASKRNVATTLTGLVSGCFIVTAEFVSALSAAVTPVEQAGGDDPRAPLEDDFDSVWPDATQYVPPAGKEPIPRGPEFYAPNMLRQTVFKGYTFIMCLQPQMDNLQGPITQGGGKALLYEDFQENVTTPENFVAFVKHSSGVTAPGELRNTGPGAVVVRITGDNAWAQEFVQKTDLLLGQRSILQNEFLDPILLNDASVMRQALEEEDEPSSAPTQSNGAGVPSTAPEAGDKLSARARRLRLTQVKSRFKGFDDFESTPLADIPMLPGGSEDDQRPAQGTHHHTATNGAPPSAQTPNKKRGIGQAGLNDILPTAAEVKRRRIQAGIEAEPLQNNAVQPTKPETKKQAKLFERRVIRKGPLLADGADSQDDIDKDLRNAVRAQADLEEQRLQIQREAELLDQPLTAEELAEVRNLIQYEDMSVRPAQTVNADATRTSAQWDDRWNGRNNFKKFRRKGQPHDNQPLRANRTTIPLELAADNANPLGAVRWAAVSRLVQQKRARRSLAMDALSGTVGIASTRTAGHGSGVTAAQRHLAMLHVVSDEDDAGVVVNKDLGSVPRHGDGASSDEDEGGASGGYAGQATGLTHVSLTPSAATGFLGSARGSLKRSAPSSAGRGTGRAAKRVASVRVEESSSDSGDDTDASEEALRFKF